MNLVLSRSLESNDLDREVDSAVLDSVIGELEAEGCVGRGEE